MKVKWLVETSGTLASEASEGCKHRHWYVGEIHLESSRSGASALGERLWRRIYGWTFRLQLRFALSGFRPCTVLGIPS